MPSVIVTVTCDDLPDPVDLELPADVGVERLLPELVRALGLAPGDYGLFRGEDRLEATATLAAAGILTGGTLALRRARPEAAGPVEVKRVAVEPPRLRPAGGDVHLADLAPSRAAPPPAASAGRTVAFWSGPAGGTGRTTLALAQAVLEAGRAADVVLLALSEPAVSAYLHLPRVPNATTFFESGNVRSAEQRVAWGEGGFQVILGPARPRDGAVDQGQIESLVSAARAAHGLVLVDLPALPPGGNAWTLEPLVRAAAVALVMLPTVAGVAATVEALATLRDVKSPAEVHLLLNRCSAEGLAARAFADGVAQLWGSCPPVAAELAVVPDLPGRVDRGELADLVLGESPLARAAAALAKIWAG